MRKKKHEVGDVWQGSDGYLVTLNENHHVERFWSRQMIERFSAAYSRTKDVDLCDEFGLTISAVKRKANKLGLKKDYRYFYELHKDALIEGCRHSNKRSRHGRIGEYARNETEEQRRVRIAHSAETRRNAPLRDKLLRKQRLLETMAKKSPEEKMSISKKISDSWKDPEKRAMRIAKLKATIASKSKAERRITNFLISEKRKAFFANETAEEKAVRCENMKQTLRRINEEKRRAM